jgi:HD-like signal output (HDOD) protein
LTVAAVARLICEKFASDAADPGDCYVAGLLHDFGKVVFAQFMSAEFVLALARSAESGTSLHSAEAEIIGADHAYVGALLAQRWQFGTVLVNCIRDHHAPDAAPAPMLDCLRMADAICRMRAYGDSGNPWRDGEQAAVPARFGADLDAVVASLGDLEKLVADARGFAQIGAEG